MPYIRISATKKLTCSRRSLSRGWAKALSIIPGKDERG